VEIIELGSAAFLDVPHQAQGPVGVLVEPSVRVSGGVSAQLGSGGGELCAEGRPCGGVEAEADDVEEVCSFLRGASVHDRL
jgi:hypothetical protein